MTLVEDSDLMGILFGFLESDTPLNLSHAGYFGRVVNALLVRRTANFMNYVRHHEVSQVLPLIPCTMEFELFTLHVDLWNCCFRL